MASYAPPRLFECLPYDIHFEVVRHLDFVSALKLASTTRFFHQTLDPRVIHSGEEVEKFIRERDKADQSRVEGLFACYHCYRFLPKDRFAKKATFERQSKKGQKITDEGRRYCFDCSAKYRVYEHLRPISNGKLRYYFCHNCGQYKTKSAKCEGPPLDIDWEHDEVPASCGLKPVTQRSGLDTLPAHLLKMIVSHIGYDDALHLAMVTRTLKETVQPVKWVALHTRFRFLRDKWAMDTLDVEIDAMEAFPCYMCCRTRPRSKFTKNQLHMVDKYRQSSWKMRCQGCVQRIYHGHGKNLMKTEYKRRRMCEICKCVRRGRETCGGCMELYVKGAIDRRTMYPDTTLNRHHDYGIFLNRLDGLFDGQDWEEG
ncbi:hypothetical protein G7Z17_g3211 [Cylindrodendrum hubeiense]|uniref:F-box domain-containing protein n=1 Tax=Cylindrodendrum hubeiense TaxID=595255 RepID=A0A9P5LIC9_9HYPO|nr:hypothetical protein G7Z17_g3211 [Cylindrodendrum hubeiense]